MHTLARVLMAMLLLRAGAQAAAPPLAKEDPFKGVVVGDAVLTYASCGYGDEVFVHRIHKNLAVKGTRAASSFRSPPRWHVGYGGFWANNDNGDRLDPGRAGLTRFDLASLLAGKLAHQPGREWLIDGGDDFAYESAVAAVQNEARSPTDNDLIDEPLFVYYDFLPFGKYKTRVFVLTNTPTPSPVRKDRGPNEDDSSAPAKKKPPLPWMLTFHRYEGRWVGKPDGDWEQRPWTREGTISGAFKEPFQALALGDDFYFVTRSGSLFRAAKPAKGKDRTLSCVWDGKGRPVESFITDAATGKTFLFVPPAKAGGRPAFFELSDKPKLVEYDPKLVPLPKLEEPHRTILHNARVLVALKKIEGKSPAKPGDKK